MPAQEERVAGPEGGGKRGLWENLKRWNAERKEMLLLSPFREPGSGMVFMTRFMVRSRGEAK